MHLYILLCSIVLATLARGAPAVPVAPAVPAVSVAPAVPAVAVAPAVPAASVVTDAAVPAVPAGRVIEKRGFSIAPPAGWKVEENYGGSSFIFRRAETAANPYPGTIDIKIFKGGLYIDNFTEAEFAETIVEKFGKSTTSVQNYRMLSHQPVVMKNGQQGILYYTDFTFESHSMMQMHVLISARTSHYLISYTDLAEMFQGASHPILDEAYLSMTSAAVKNPIGNRLYSPVVILGGTVSVIVLVVLALVIRKFFHTRKFDSFYTGIEKSDDGETADETSASSSSRSDAEPAWNFFEEENSQDNSFNDTQTATKIPKPPGEKKAG